MARDVSHAGVIIPQRPSFQGEKVAYHPAVSVDKWDILYITDVLGAGACLSLDLADADAVATAAGTLFCASHAAAPDTQQGNNPVAYCHRMILVGPVDTSAATVRDPVYLSTMAGGWTLTAPNGSGDVVRIIGYVEKVSSTDGYWMFDQSLSGGDGVGYTVVT